MWHSAAATPTDTQTGKEQVRFRGYLEAFFFFFLSDQKLVSFMAVVYDDC